MKKRVLTVLLLWLSIGLFSTAWAFPEFSEESMTKIVMPEGLVFFMKQDDAIALLKKRHPVEVHDSGAFYEVTRDGLRESYGIRFVCHRVWAIQYALAGPDNADFYERLAPLKAFIEKLRPYYFGPVYGEYNIKVALVEDERIKLEIFDSAYDGTASIQIDHFLGDLFEEPVMDCPPSQ